MLDMSAITLVYVYKVTPPFTDISVKTTLVTVVAMLWQLHFLVFAET